MNYVARQSYVKKGRVLHKILDRYTYVYYHFQEDANDMAAHIDILQAITWKQLQKLFGFYLSITNIALQSFARYLESPEDPPYS